MSTQTESDNQVDRETGGPAFPHPGGSNDATVQISHLGMTLRDYFAAKALQGLLANEEVADECASGDFSLVVSRYAQLAYTYADAMLKARVAAESDAVSKLLDAAVAAEAVLAKGRWVEGSTDPEAVALFALRAAIAKATGRAA